LGRKTAGQVRDISEGDFLDGASPYASPRTTPSEYDPLPLRVVWRGFAIVVASGVVFGIAGPILG